MVHGKVGPPAGHVVETEVDGRVSLYDGQTEQVAMLNETASDVWRLCDGMQSLDEMVDALARAYGVEPDAIREQVTDTVTKFRCSGLLTAPDAA